MTTTVSKAFGTRASRLSLTLLLPIALVGCATSERDRDAKEAEEQQQERQEMERQQQDDRQQNERQELDRQQDEGQLEEGRIEQPNPQQGQVGGLNRGQGQMGQGDQDQGQLGEQGQIGDQGLIGERETDERRSTAGEYIDDSVITANVKAALAGDDLVKAYQVNVKTVKGVVQLSGFVSSNDVQSRADVVASAVEGVVSVENDLLVK